VLAKPTERGRSVLQDACEIRAELETRFLGRLPAARALAFVDALEELARATE
jgi:hypothetical protein